MPASDKYKRMPELCNNVATAGCYLYAVMKKFLVLVLLTLYMGSATGATLRMHYCKGRLIEVQLTSGADGHCAQCGAAAPMDCCKSEHKTFKLDKDQQTAGNAPWVLPAAVVAIPPSIMAPSPSPLQGTAPRPISHAPPPGKVHPYLLYCIFRI